MKAALTGGSGFIANMFRQLYGDKLDILPLDLYGFARPGDAQTVETDYSVDHLVNLLEGCDGIIHLAYAKATAENEKRGLSAFFPSMQTTENLLVAARKLGIANIVFASSRCVYGLYTEERYREDDALFPINFYGISKMSMEQLCMYYNRKYNTKAKVLRFGQIIGANMGDRSLFATFLNNALAGAPLKLIGSNIRDYLYIKDACKALYDAVTHPEQGGIYNISMGVGINNAQIAETMLRVLNSTSRIETEGNDVPQPADRIILDCDKARDELGFSCGFASLDRIIEDVVANR